MQILFDEKHITCYFKKDIPVLSHKWKGFASSQQLRSGLLRCLEEYIKLKRLYPSLHWLSNSQNLKVIAPADMEWLNTEWATQLYSTGLTRHAFVVPEDIFAQLAINKFTKQSHDNYGHQDVIVQYFKSEEEAEEWLKQQ